MARILLAVMLLTILTCSVTADQWSARVNVSGHSDYNRWPSVHGDSQGWHYTYMQGDQGNNFDWKIYYRMQRHDGTWTTPLRIGNVGKSEDSQSRAYSDGTRFCIFQAYAANGYEWFYTQQSGTTWSNPVTFTPDDGYADLATNSDRIFDIDSEDTIHLCSQHNDGSQYNMRYYEKPRYGALIDHGDIYNTGDYQLNGAVKATGSGASKRVHFLVNGGSSVGAWRCYYRRWNNPGWGPLINLSNLLGITPGGSHAGNILQLPNGRLAACLACKIEPSGSWEVWLIFSDDNGDSWHSAVNVSQNSGLSRNPSAVTNSDGDVIVCWEDDNSGDWSAYARRWRNGRLGRTYKLGSGFGPQAGSYGKTTRIAWIDNPVSDWEVYTSENLGADSIAPAPVSQFAAAASDGAVHLSWKNPSDPDLIGVMVRYKTGGYPTGPTDGTLLCDLRVDPNYNGTYSHSNLPNGTIYYYAAFAYDINPNYSTATQSSATPHALTTGDVKLYPENTPVDLLGKVITAIFSSDLCLYVSEPDRSSAIRVETSAVALPSLQIGDRINITGKVTSRLISGVTAERQISATAIAKTQGTMNQPLGPLAMKCLSIGGGPASPLVPGVINGFGLNNIGMLVKISGKVTAKLSYYIWVDDGSNTIDTTGRTGIMIKCPDTYALVSVGNIVSVTGITEGNVPSGYTANRRYIRIRDYGDLRVIGQ